MLLAFLAAAASAATALTEADLVRQVAPAMEANDLQAVSLGVIQPQGSAAAHAGTLAPGQSTPPDDRTLYEIGSISKVFTSLLLAEAVVRGELTLDTPIASLLPDDVVLPNQAGDRITLRMLATHTSGLPRIPAEIPLDDYTNPYAAFGEAELWASLRRVQLDFEPGTKASYSNLAAGLLGTLLARHAGVSYAELLAARLTRPLGMNDTVIELDAEARTRLAPAFRATGQRWTHWDFQALAGAGGIRSTLPDMMRFARAMLHPAETPLQKAIDLAWARQELTATFFPGGQALGWLIAMDRGTRWHNGVTGGFHCALFVNRELGVATVLLANRSTPLAMEIAERLVRRAAGVPEPRLPHQNRAEVALTLAQLERCTGTFRLTPQFALVCDVRNGALHVTPTNQITDRLYAASADTFFSRRVPAEIVFELPADGGAATALVLKQGGQELRAVRE